MSGPLDIQRPALGLADLLGLRAGGATPQYLADAVGGEIDLTDMYLAQRRTSTFLTGAITTGAGLYTFNQLPAANIQPGTCYLVYSAFATYVTPAAATFNAALCVKRAAFVTLQGLTFIAATDHTTVAGEVICFGRYFEKPLIMLPGDNFALQINQWTGAGAFPGLYVDYVQLTT